MTPIESKADHAQRIQEHHKAAHAAADAAIEHAKEAGRLLLEVKASLPHGDFTPWIEANLTVSPRQAQRYMQAAQGKELVRKSKSDTVSFLTCTDAEPKSAVKTLAEIFAPEWVPMRGYSYACTISSEDAQSIYVVGESDKHPGYFHVSRMYGPKSDPEGWCDLTRRPITGVAVESTLKGFGLDSPADADWEIYKGRTFARPVGEPEEHLEGMKNAKMVIDAPQL